MILQTIDFSLCAQNSQSDTIPSGIVILVCVCIFIAATAVGGMISYKYKMKKYAEKRDTETSAKETKER